MDEFKAHLILDRKSFQVLRRVSPNGGDGELLSRTKFDYANAVGTGLDSALIIAVVRWIARAFSEAPLAIRDPEEELQSKHPLLDLWRRPNPWYGERILRGALALDYTINGNAYLWIAERDGAKRPTQLLYLPSWEITPEGSKTDLITSYKRGGTQEPIPASDMVHFRMGLDPKDMRLGLSNLRPLLREIFTDDQAAHFTASVLRNMGFAGVVIQPEEEGDRLSPKAAQRFKRYFARMFRGDNLGEALVTSARIRIGAQEIDLAKLDLGALRDIPEERVTAVTGVPAAVVGFGTGLQQTKVGATLEELRKLAYNNAIIPMQADICEELTRKLLPEFEPKPGYAVAFDNRDVQALQEDETKRATRYAQLYTAGVITRAAALRALGEEATPADEVYRTSVADIFLPVGTLPEDPEEPEPDSDEDGEELEPPIPPKARLSPRKGYRAPGEKSGAPALRRRRLDRRFLADFETLSRSWSRELAKSFLAYGEEIARAWRAEQGKAWAAATKAEEPIIDDLDEVTPGRAFELLLMEHPPALPDYGPHFLRVARRTVAGIDDVLGLAVDLDEPMEREILRLGGVRKGLVDMDGETRDALFRALSDAREQGLGVDATARRIRDGIAAGPWPNVQTRATVIARTETKWAQNASSVQAYAGADNITGLQVFDAQLGDTDDPCMQANGRIVDKHTLGGLEMLEHPACTRSYAPVVG